MTWEIFLGIVALVSFIGTVGLWISKLSKVLAVLETTVGSLAEAIKEFKANSKVEHKELHRRIDNHESRILILETKANEPKT